jgi:hypothetical protein
LHAPQFCGFVFVSTHTPLQFVSPAAQPLMQLPWLQKVPALQALVQLPQWLLSVDGSTQTLLHKSWPAGQPQTPPWQDCPTPQSCPQEPQFWGSVLVSTQAPEQLVSLGAHPDWHSEPLQTGFGGWQVWPQLPQLLGSVAVFTQTPPQLVRPFGQTSTQLPPWHTWFNGQRLPQLPQLLGSVFVLVQVPLQRTSPVEQFAAHTPMSQRSMLGQTWLHWPQLLGSMFVFVHTPPQLCWPVGQAQVPDWQIWLAVQALVQLPQCCGSICSLTQL